MALAMLMVQKQEVLTKIENENISRKQNYRTLQCCCRLQTFMNSKGRQKISFSVPIYFTVFNDFVMIRNSGLTPSYETKHRFSSVCFSIKSNSVKCSPLTWKLCFKTPLTLFRRTRSCGISEYKLYGL